MAKMSRHIYDQPPTPNASDHSKRRFSLGGGGGEGGFWGGQSSGGESNLAPGSSGALGVIPLSFPLFLPCFYASLCGVKMNK